jgi:hypothetical protein
MNKKKTIICLSVASVSFLVAMPFVFICGKEANSPYTSAYHFSEQYGYFIDALNEVPDDGSNSIVLKLNGEAADPTANPWELTFSAPRKTPTKFVLKIARTDSTKTFTASFYFSAGNIYTGYTGIRCDMDYSNVANPQSDSGYGTFVISYDGTLSMEYTDSNKSLTSYYEALTANDFGIISSALKTEAVTMTGKVFLLERATSVRDFQEALNDEYDKKRSQVFLAAFCGAVAVASLIFGSVVTFKYVRKEKHPNAL